MGAGAAAEARSAGKAMIDGPAFFQPEQHGPEAADPNRKPPCAEPVRAC